MPYLPIFDSTALSIADDTAYDVESDAYDGSAVKVEPSVGQLEQGLWRPARQVAAQHMNWWMSQMALVALGLISNDTVHEDELADHAAELADHETRLDSLEEYVDDHSPRIQVVEFLADGTYVVPPRCVALFAYGCGGGGGGGGGAFGTTTIQRWYPGAGGGGGALASFQVVRSTVAGETLNVVVGAGGFGAVPAQKGGDGGDTQVRRGSNVLNAWAGAQGGEGVYGTATLTYIVSAICGGMPVRNAPKLNIGNSINGMRWDTSTGNIFGKTADGGPHCIILQLVPAQGGWGCGGYQLVGGNLTARAGARNPVGGFAGGAGGPTGTDGDPNFPPGNTDRKGGGGGGGGGAGPFGPGGFGGAGQHGEASQSTAGGTPLANSGAGGGGGGSCGFRDGTGFPSVTGGGADGGSGRLYMIAVVEQ